MNCFGNRRLMSSLRPKAGQTATASVGWSCTTAVANTLFCQAEDEELGQRRISPRCMQNRCILNAILHSVNRAQMRALREYRVYLDRGLGAAG